MLENAIVSFAGLNLTRNSGSSYVDLFIPFLTECLRNSPSSVAATHELQVKVSQEFGLNIPQNVIKLLLNRIHRQGYLLYRDGKYEKTSKLNNVPDVATIRDDSLRKYQAIIDRLIRFCLERYQVTWSQDQAENAFLAYLERHSTALLTASLGKSLVLATATPVEHADFLLNAFILDLYERDPNGFDFLEMIVKGRLLANFLYYSDVNQVSQKVKGLTLYFDSRLVLRLLGFAGPYFEVPCKEMVALFSDENTKFAVFDHTLSEMYRILDAVRFAISRRANGRRAYGEIFDNFVRENKRASDVELIIARLPQLLDEQKLEIVERPSHIKSIGLDESKFTQVLQAEMLYRSSDALQHDLDAITAIHRLRNGQTKRTFEDCKAVFVTTNYPLAKTSALFFRKEYEGSYVPLCVTDDVIATVMWTKKPLAFPDLPKRRIIADCYAAINPKDILWREFLDEIDRLNKRGDISDDDYNILRYSSESRQILMDTTFGAPEAFVEGSIEMILDRSKELIRAEVTEELERQKAQNEEQKTYSAGLTDLFSEAQERSIEQMSQHLTSLTRVKEKLDRKSEKEVKRILWLYFVDVVAFWILIVTLIFVKGWDVMEKWTFILSIPIPILVYLYFVATLRELNPLGIYHELLEIKQHKNYVEAGFDIAEYEKLLPSRADNR